MSIQTPSNNKNKNNNIWSDLPRRLTTVCIGFPLVWMILSIPTLALIFFIVVHTLVCWEYTTLEPAAKATNSKSMSTPTTTTTTTSHNNLNNHNRFGFMIVSLLLAHVSNNEIFHLLLVCITGIFVWQHKHHYILGLIVITIPFRTWYIISQDFASTISILLVVWNCDTGALLFGRVSKKLLISEEKKLLLPVPYWIQQISPAKSIEGFFGGFVGGTWTTISWIPRLISWFNVDTSDAFINLWGLQQTSIKNRFLLGMSLSFLAIVGDLVESSIKRQSQSKDSGSILPGHGGILDRFDSSLLAVLLYYVLITNNES